MCYNFICIHAIMAKNWPFPFKFYLCYLYTNKDSEYGFLEVQFLDNNSNWICNSKNEIHITHTKYIRISMPLSDWWHDTNMNANEVGKNHQIQSFFMKNLNILYFQTNPKWR